MIVNKIMTLFCIFGLLVNSTTNASESNVKASKLNSDSIKLSAKNESLLMLATGTFDPLSQRLNFVDTNINNAASNKYGIIQFSAKKSNYKWLQVNGFDVLQNIPNNAFLVNWSTSDKNLLSNNKDIRWFGAFQSGYKVSPRLWLQNRNNNSSFQIAIHTFKDIKNFNLNGLIKKYFPDAITIKTNIPKVFNNYVIEVEGKNINTVLNKLASVEDIQWIGPYHAQKFYNNEAVSSTQATSDPIMTPIFDQGIYGSGQIIGVADSGLDRNEDWFMHLNKGSGVVTAITDAENVTPPLAGTIFPDNKVFAYWTMPGAQDYDIGSFHGTHVTGSVAGDRLLGISGGSISNPTSSGYNSDDGMAPNAQILFQDIGGELIEGQVSLSGVGSTPMWQQAYSVGVAIHSNSYGSNSNGKYTGSDKQADQTLRELEEMIILFAAGNEGPGSNTIGSAGNAKNVTTVGALGANNSNAVASFSSRGPTDDGRLKPDIMATGTSIESAAGDSNNDTIDSSPSISSKQGTSMATPITAGSTALLRQYFMDGFYPTGSKNLTDSITPSGPLMKAILLNGTKTDGGFFNNNVGWGRVWLENSLYFTGETKRMRIWELANTNGLKTGEQFSASVQVQVGQEFRATLVWYDLEGPVGSGLTLVNNLDLNVQTGAGTYLANNFSSNNSITGGTTDSINTVEQVRFSNPVAGTYTITVDANNIPGNGSFNSGKQGFALVVSGDLSSGNAIGANPVGPSNLALGNNDLTGLLLNWTAASNDYDHYEVYRMIGGCSSVDSSKIRYIGSSSTNSYLDSKALGGYQYAYKVRAFSDDIISEYSNCIDAISSQICDSPPSFNSTSIQVTNSQAALCQVSMAWDAANSRCPTVNDIQYNIYRSTTHGFTPNGSNLLATSVLNATNFIDYTTQSGQTYFYVVKAEDTTTTGTGPNNGNESLAIKEVAATSLGVTTIEGNLLDDVDNISLMKLTSSWSISSEQKSNGLLSYRSAIEGSNLYEANVCARMYSPTFEIPSSPTSPPQITYQTRYDIEPDWDGVVVEISEDGGFSWNDLPPDAGYPSDFALTQGNACGYASTQGAFNDTSGNIFIQANHDLSSFQGKSIQVRWSLSTDGGVEGEGYYLDELQYSNVLVPQACLAGSHIFANGFEN